MDQPFEIPFKSFDRGRYTTPVRGSFFGSSGLNPFIEKQKLLSKYKFINAAKSSVFTTLKNVVAFVLDPTTSLDLYAFNGADGHVSKRTSGTWADYRTNGNGGNKGAFVAPDSATPANKVIYYIDNAHVGRAVTPYGTPGDWTDSWNALTASVPHKHAIIRDWALITNGRYLAGWKFSTGVVENFQANLLDFQVGYESFKIAGNKVAGVRLVYIAATYADDRARDGVFVWDLNATAPIDFIPVPWLSDIYVSGGVLWAIHGNELNVSELNSVGPIVENSIIDSVILKTDAGTGQASATFLGRWGPFLLLSVVGDRSIMINGEGFFSGVWCYHIPTKSLFFWLPPSSGDLNSVTPTAMFSQNDRDLTMAFSVTDSAGTRYYIDTLSRIYSQTGTYYDLLYFPVLGEDNSKMKLWEKLTFNHSLLETYLSSYRIQLWVKDFRRRHRVIPVFGSSVSTIVSVGNTTFVTANTLIPEAIAGDLILVLSGAGAGQVRRITSVVAGATNTTYTIDRAWDTNPTTDSLLEWQPYVMVGEVSTENEDNDQKKITINVRSVRMRPLIVMNYTINTHQYLTDGIELRNLIIAGKITT